MQHKEFPTIFFLLACSFLLPWPTVLTHPFTEPQHKLDSINDVAFQKKVSWWWAKEVYFKPRLVQSRIPQIIKSKEELETELIQLMFLSHIIPDRAKHQDLQSGTDWDLWRFLTGLCKIHCYIYTCEWKWLLFYDKYPSFVTHISC